MSMTHEITHGAPRNTKRTRKGRGRSGDKGKTAGRGTKGAKARSGKYVKRGHEHGQMPIFRRLPKRGFSNFQFERRFHVVNLVDLERFEDGTTVDASTLEQAGLIPGTDLPVKILGNGEFTRKLTVQAGHFSKSAYDRIVQLGGVAQNAKGEAFEFPKVKKPFVNRKLETGSRKMAAAKAQAESVEAQTSDTPAAE